MALLKIKFLGGYYTFILYTLHMNFMLLFGGFYNILFFSVVCKVLNKWNITILQFV